MDPFSAADLFNKSATLPSKVLSRERTLYPCFHWDNVVLFGSFLTRFHYQKGSKASPKRIYSFFILIINNASKFLKVCIKICFKSQIDRRLLRHFDDVIAYVADISLWNQQIGNVCLWKGLSVPNGPILTRTVPYPWWKQGFNYYRWLKLAICFSTNMPLCKLNQYCITLANLCVLAHYCLTVFTVLLLTANQSLCKQ